MSEPTATRLKDTSVPGKTNAALYRFDPPIDGHPFAVVSAATPLGVAETYVFPADEDGNVTDWAELSASQRGTLDHATVLGDAGYDIEETDE